MGDCCTKDERTPEQTKEKLENKSHQKQDDYKNQEKTQPWQNPTRQSVFMPNYDAMSPKTQQKYQPQFEIQINKRDSVVVNPFNQSRQSNIGVSQLDGTNVKQRVSVMKQN